MIKLFRVLLLVSLSVNVQAFQLERLPSYESHRDRFNSAVSELKDYNVEKFNWSINNKADIRLDQNLSTEVALVTNKKVKPEKILVLSSGIHGVESYVGSSVQIAFIKNYLQKSQGNFDFAFIHILNPWGMKNNRRVNIDNVDLNRNFLANSSEFQKKNESYEKIDPFLNPQTQLQLHFAHQFIFILDSLYYIMRYSMESLRQGILQGQYQRAQGIYYGGSVNDLLKNNIDQFYGEKLSGYKEIFWIDLHTGYGERGHLHLLSNEANDENARRLQRFLPGRHIDFGQNKKFYKTTGDMISYLSGQIKSTHFAGVAFEYGTMDSQRPLGSIESLRRMVVENQSYQFNREAENRKDVEKLFLDMYNPDDEDWWMSISLQTQELFDQILK